MIACSEFVIWSSVGILVVVGFVCRAAWVSSDWITQFDFGSVILGILIFWVGLIFAIAIPAFLSMGIADPTSSICSRKVDELVVSISIFPVLLLFVLQFVFFRKLQKKKKRIGSMIFAYKKNCLDRPAFTGGRERPASGRSRQFYFFERAASK